jgi:hypothetical protein
MILRKRWILLLGLMSCLVWSQREGIVASGKAWIAELRARRFCEDATRYRTFVLNRDRAIDFQVPANPRTVRIFTNASMFDVEPLRVTLDDPRPGHRYCVRYEVLDQLGRVLETADYHFRARVNQYRNPETSEVFTTTMFDKSTSIPAATRTLQLPMEHVAGKADRVRLRLVDADEQIEGVVARVFCCRERSGYKNAATWGRLSPERREILARASVYSPDLLGPYERRNLLRWRWSPLAPLGVESIDFERRTLYVQNEVNGEEITPVESVNGVAIDAAQHGVVALPAEQGLAHLQIFKRPVDARLPAEPDTACEVTVRWYGLGLDHRFEKRLKVDSFGEIVDVPCDGGLIDIESTHRAIANVSWRKLKSSATGKDSSADRTRLAEYESPVPLQPERRYLRTMLISPEKSVTYEISHPQGQATPMRAVVRGFAKNDEGARTSVGDPPQVEWSTPAVRWQYLDADGQPLDQGEVAIDPLPSSYDRINMSPGRRLVTEPVEAFFDVPANVTAVRFDTLEEAALISLATRPYNLPREVMVPEEYSALLRTEIPHRTWFPIRPRKHLELVEQNETVSIQIQPRPPEDDPLITAGEFAWEAFQPKGVWAGRQLVTPRVEKAPRVEALATCFYQLEAGKEQPIRCLAEPQAAWVTPRLLYFRKSTANRATTPAPALTLTLDGQKIHESTLRAMHGEIELPRRPASQWLDANRIQVSVDDEVVVLMNYCHLPDHPSFLKRTAQKLNNGTLRFDFEKIDAEELLIVKLYRPLPQTDRVHLRSELEYQRTPDGKPSPAWTITRKRFDLAVSQNRPDTSAWVLGTGGQITDGGLPCFLPLGPDVPAGTYRVTLTAEDFRDGYVMLYRTRPGYAPTREWKFEPRPTDDIAELQPKVVP